jgi:hypothetical protein
VGALIYFLSVDGFRIISNGQEGPSRRIGFAPKERENPAQGERLLAAKPWVASGEAPKHIDQP